MVRLRRTSWVNGQKHETYIVINESEWRVLKKNMEAIVNKDPRKGIHLEVVDSNDKLMDISEVVPDDKVTLETYEELRISGEKHYKKKEYSDALYFFEKAGAIRSSIWITGRINKCIANLTPGKDDNSDKKKQGRKSAKGK
jgi:hypothetical protein